VTIIFEKTPLRCALMKLCVMPTSKTDNFFRKVSITDHYDGFRSSVEGFNRGRFADYSLGEWPNPIFIPDYLQLDTVFFQHLKTMHSRIKKHHILTNEMEF